MARLFDPLTLRGLTVRNRVWLAPMCQYSCARGDGVPGDWHLMHLGARAAGGFGLIVTEATAVSPQGRISPQDTGIWDIAQVAPWRRIVDFVHLQGAAIAMQIAHAGRKGSLHAPYGPSRGSIPLDEGGWDVVGPSALAFTGYAMPHELAADAISSIVDDFASAARRCEMADFDAIEIHAAHGYLLHSFLSPLSNRRTDEYGGSLENRARLLLAVVDRVREEWPASKPLLVRVSASDWMEGGWDLDECIRVAAILRDRGVDLIDVSSGGLAAEARYEIGRAYQVPFARSIRRESLIPTGAVGLIDDPHHADAIIDAEAADVVLLGRAALREPSWPLRAAHELGIDRRAAPYPIQYRSGSWKPATETAREPSEIERQG